MTLVACSEAWHSPCPNFARPHLLLVAAEMVATASTAVVNFQKMQEAIWLPAFFRFSIDK